MNKSANVRKNENDQYCSKLALIQFLFSPKVTPENMQSACENRT